MDSGYYNAAVCVSIQGVRVHTTGRYAPFAVSAGR
jgi:hypothetical protein